MNKFFPSIQILFFAAMTANANSTGFSFDEAAPEANSEEVFSQQLLPEDITPEAFEEILGDRNKRNTTIWLHTKVKRTCYYLYDKHWHEAWVTIGSKNGPAHKVSKLTLTSWAGSSTGNGQDRSCRDCSKQDRLIEEYNLYCRMSCARGRINDSFTGRQVCVR